VFKEERFVKKEENKRGRKRMDGKEGKEGRKRRGGDGKVVPPFPQIP